MVWQGQNNRQLKALKRKQVMEWSLLQSLAAIAYWTNKKKKAILSGPETGWHFEPWAPHEPVHPNCEKVTFLTVIVYPRQLRGRQANLFKKQFSVFGII